MRQSVKGGPQSGAAEQPKNQNGYEPVALSGSQGACEGWGERRNCPSGLFFFVDPSASQNSPSKRWQRARIKAFCAGIEY